LNARAAQFSIALASLIAVLAIVPAAQAAPAPNWGQEHPTNAPSARQGAAMAYDADSQEMVLFGGSTQQGAILGDTWTWDGEDWTLEHPATSPAPRTSADMAFDQSTGQLILVGGQPNSGNSGETWSWDGSTWTELAPAPGVFNPAVAYDGKTESVLLFGGTNSNGDDLNSTWSWDGSSWTQLDPQTSPPARWGAEMAYDPVNEEMVLFGGVYSGGGFQDTWTWNGTTWTQESPPTAPPPSFGMSMAYSPLVGKVIRPSGQDPVTGKAETWGWDGSDWSRVSTFGNPPARVDYPMALDEARNEVVLFGGFTMEGSFLDDTWTFGIQTDQAPTVTISSPSDGDTFEVGERVPVNFSCSAAPDGPPVASCKGSDGSSAPSGLLDTSSLGGHTYAVVATAVDGQNGGDTVEYQVVKKSPPDPPEPRACRKISGGLTLGTFGLVPPFGDAPPVAGLRIRVGARGDVVAKISPTINYPTRTGTGTVALRTRTIRIDHSRKLRFRLPNKTLKRLRHLTGSAFGNRVRFRLGAKLKARGDRNACFRGVGTRSVRTKVVNVSSRVALRRL
jgi:hypothetical protein